MTDGYRKCQQRQTAIGQEGRWVRAGKKENKRRDIRVFGSAAYPNIGDSRISPYSSQQQNLR